MFKRNLFNKKTALIFLIVVSYNLVSYLLPAATDVVSFTETSKNYTFIVNLEKTNYTYPLNTLASDDYRRLIDIRNFNFTILPKNLCFDTTLLLILVHSSPQHFKQRDLIRRTWGMPNSMLKLVFLVGLVPGKQLQKDLEEESSLHSDLAQGNFLDTYRNLTYKHMSALKYAIYHCPQAKYILKTDDDIFINMPLMEKFLIKDLSTYGTSNLLFCKVIRNAYALRSSRSKWYVTYEEYPNETYPTFCLGWTILYSPDVLFALYKSGQNSKYFWVDDVHITGIMAKKNNISHADLQSLAISGLDLWLLKYFRMEPKKYFLFGKADLQPNEIELLWKYVTSHPVPESAFKI